VTFARIWVDLGLSVMMPCDPFKRFFWVEKARLGSIVNILTPNLLVALMKPTNHLDLDMRSALNRSAARFPVPFYGIP